ncbi:unnamed protein product, partial [Lymnaea stagnalis]
YEVQQEPLLNEALSLEFTPYKIIAVDEVKQTVTVSCYISLRWRDDNLRWNRSEFGGIDMFVINSTDLWTPSIYLPRSDGHGLRLDRTDHLTIKTQRFMNVVSTFLFQFTVFCELDLSMYPFDFQTCEITFSQMHGYKLSSVESKEYDFQLAQKLQTSGEWAIISWNASRSWWQGDLHFLAYVIKIERHSTYYVANLLTPICLTAVMTLLVFWIPAESGEKMSFLVSMFVSTSVFLYTINDVMPRSINTLPTINIVVVAVSFEMFLAAIATLVSLRRHSR